MKVWVMTWDVQNNGTGVEVFATQSAACEAVLGYAGGMSLLRIGKSGGNERARLERTGLLEFDPEGCSFRIEEMDVQ